MQAVKDYTKFKSYLDDRVRHYPFLSDMALFYKGLLDIWSASQPDDLSVMFKIQEAMSPGRDEEHSCLFDAGMIMDPDFNNSIKIAMKVFELFGENRQGDNKSIGCAGSSADAVREFIREGLSKEDRFKNAVLKWSLKPSFESTIARLRIKSTGGKGRCPLCASPPAMSIVFTPENETSERRLLSCCFCTYRWQFPVTCCPYCSNQRPERFGLIVGDSVRDQCVRAVSCEECHTYLKTVFTGCRSDRKKADDLDMDVEDVATLNLDIMADQRGFSALCQRS